MARKHQIIEKLKIIRDEKFRYRKTRTQEYL